ncbi:uncharacterized protein LOC115876773 isoform X1 [Sitophilus oryzae]|uniref:Uncharacterized protein LOC115876773 isoform X1 n=1 Tax=Sitophilus oryzae TaxID=7048 RepID=A0A6J2XB79_SITOR|nr:uncharacterized protein LOC115876773 isoform X1 [Sitophilus oryzae]
MSETVDYDDSSDEEVCFGEYTLKEAKRDLRKYIPHIPNRRHTTFLKSMKPNTLASPAKDVQQLSTCLKECLNISTTPSDYVTADESVSTNKEISNGNFLKELERIINEPCSKESSYNTAHDHVTTSNSLTEELHNTNTDLECFQDATSNLDKIQLTLVENTISPENDSNLDTSTVSISSGDPNDSIIVLSDDSITDVPLDIKQERYERNSALSCGSYREHSSFEDNGIDHTKSLYDENEDSEAFQSEDNIGSSGKETNNLLSNIHLSTYTSASNKNNYNWNELSKISEKERYERNTSLSRGSYREHSSSEDNGIDHTNSLYEENEDSEALESADNIGCSVKETNLLSNIHLLPYTPSRNKNNYNWNVLSKISEKTEQPTFASMHPLQDCSLSGLQEISYSESSQGSNDYSNLPNKTSSDEGCESSQHLNDFEIPEINLDQFNDSTNFDDTMEDINRFLAEALEKDKEKERCKEFLSAEKITKIPKLQLSGAKTVTKYKHSAEDFKKISPAAKKPLFSSAGVKPKPKDLFKEPTKPIKKALTPIKSKNMFLNVVSPVSVYINNTPKYSPVVKNRTTVKKNYEIGTPGSARKENVPIKVCSINDEIPPVIYKPSSYVKMTEEKGVNLPDSIKKLIKVTTLTKHAEKIIQDPNQSIERRLLEDDLSVDSTNHDISVVIQKQAFKIKK